MPVEWREQGEVRYLFSDFRNLRGNELAANLQRESDALRAHGPGVRVLADFTGAVIDPEFMDQIKAAGRTIHRTHVERTAVLGITGIKKLLLRSYLLFTGDSVTQAFDTEDDALAWLRR